MMVTGQQARSRRFTCEQLAAGFGILLLEAPDFSRAERDRLVAAIISTYDAGELAGEVLDLARRIGQALSTTLPTLAALRAQLGTDGWEMAAQIRTVTRVVPALWALIEWIAL